jgi:hypothetical protein
VGERAEHQPSVRRSPVAAATIRAHSSIAASGVGLYTAATANDDALRRSCESPAARA